MKYLDYTFAKDYEYKEFLFKANKRNKIRLFFKKLIQQMPNDLSIELKLLPTQLEKVEEGSVAITGGEAYVFCAKGSSKKLQEYMNKFLVIVEKDTEEIIKWRSNLKILKNSYNLAT